MAEQHIWVMEQEEKYPEDVCLCIRCEATYTTDDGCVCDDALCKECSTCGLHCRCFDEQPLDEDDFF